ncbi:MAG: PAS domain-containing protein [Bacteroidia bacterium]|nr:PAS domain-containing protein [Bacteroidia bacterium]
MKGKHFLVFFTDPALPEQIVPILRESFHGYEIMVADSLVGFRQALEEQEPALVISQYQRGEFSGKLILQMSLFFCPETPVIFIVNKNGEGDAAEILREGATDYILSDHLAKIPFIIRRVLAEAASRRSRNEALEELRREKQILKEVTSSIPGLVYRYLRNPQGKVRYDFISDNAHFIWGFAPEELLRDHTLLFSRIHRDDLPVLLETYRKADVEGRFLCHRFRVRWIDGSEKWLRDDSTFHIDTDGHTVRVGSIMDVTASTEAEIRIRNFSKHLNKVVEEERARLAREIHDELGQQVTGLRLSLFSLRNHLPATASAALDTVQELIGETDRMMQSVRKVATDLRPGVLDTLGLSASIGWLAEEFRRKTGIPIKYETNMKDAKVDKRISIELFRICQEAMNNAVKHSDCTAMELILFREENDLSLVIGDNGRGFTPGVLQNEFSTGLMGMKERASGIDGEFNVESAPGEGTLLIVKVPLIQAA